MNKEKSLSEQILEKLCYHSCNIMDGWIPYPCTIIAQQLGVSVYKVRKEMRKLVADGYVVRKSCVIDPEESMLPYNGFVITDKARKTEAYKKAVEREAEIMEQYFDIPKDDVIRSYLGDGGTEDEFK